VADDVVVEDRLNGNLLCDGLLRVQPRPDQPLLFADVAHEDEGRVEVDAALAEDPRELDRQRRAAAVVVHPGGEVVERRIGIEWRAAPMPRVVEVVDESVLRVWKRSSFFRIAPSRSSETVDTSLTMRGSRSLSCADALWLKPDTTAARSTATSTARRERPHP